MIRYEVIAVIQQADEQMSILIEKARFSIQGYGDFRRKRSEGKYLVFFSTRYPEFIKKFKIKIKQYCGGNSVKFTERKVEW